MTKVSSASSAWGSADFRRVWGAGAVAGLGAEIGELAIPVLAVVTLAASAAELSFVRAALFAPFLILTLGLGVVVDRRRRRPLMILADVARGGILAAIATLALTGTLTVPVLIGAAAALGAFTVLYTLADFSLVPLVVSEHQLIDANARVTATQSAIGIAGSGVGGALVQLLTAPVALVFNAAGYLFSALLIGRTRVREPVPQAGPRRSVFREAGQGLAVLWRHRSLRALVGEAAVWNLGNEVLLLALVVLVVGSSDAGPLLLGIILMAGGAGAVIGSLLSARMTRRWGYGRSLVTCMLIGNGAPVVAVLAGTSAPGALVPALAIGFAVSGVGIGVANSQAVSLRQLAVESTMRGRANAAYRLVSWGALSIGALAGGVAVSALGAPTAAVVGGSAMALATLPVALSRVRSARTIEEASRPPR